MNIRNITFALAILTSLPMFSQENNIITSDAPKISFLDSIKKSFVVHEFAACIDNRWSKEMSSQDLYTQMIEDIENINIDQKVDYKELSTELLKERLKILDSKSAFHIEYNEGLENIIKHYLKNRKKSYERLMALSQYYFPIFEEALAKYNVPLEIKYLAIVESALNPRAVSKAGATGLWQFMYATGKQYNLEITTFEDERSNVLKSSEAACQYMVNMYRIFGDWDLVLASYNAGPGNVSKAIRRSGGKQNYWNIRNFLPRETQGYVPAFIATMYIYEFHKEHGIVPNKPIVNNFETDTIMVKKPMKFQQIADLLDISVEQIQFLNPSYKRDYIPFQADKKYFLKLPLEKIAIFASNEDKIYAYTDFDFNKREKQFSNDVASSNDDTDTKTIFKTKYHKVRRGETLSGIADKYNVSLSEIKKWNNLRSNVIGYGKSLKIVTTHDVAVVKPIVKQEKVVVAEVKKDSVLNKATKVSSNSDVYIVEKGDNINAIARKFNVSTDNLKEWNNLDDDTVVLGASMTIHQPKKEELYDRYFDYTIQKGESIHSIAKKYVITEDELMKWNDLESGVVLKSGSVLKIFTKKPESPIEVKETKYKKEDVAIKKFKTKTYTVKSGDSLFSIANKIPGVTVADLKKWNGIRGANIKPGMQLKING